MKPTAKNIIYAIPKLGQNSSFFTSNVKTNMNITKRITERIVDVATSWTVFLDEPRKMKITAIVNCAGRTYRREAAFGPTNFVRKVIPTITPPPIKNCKK